LRNTFVIVLIFVNVKQNSNLLFMLVHSALTNPNNIKVLVNVEININKD